MSVGVFITEDIAKRPRTRATKDARMVGGSMVGERYVAVEIYCMADEVGEIVTGRWFNYDLRARRHDDSKPMLVTIHTELA